MLALLMRLLLLQEITQHLPPCALRAKAGVMVCDGGGSGRSGRSGAHEPLVIATWNVQRLSLAKSDDALLILAGVVDAVDVLAVQEVVDDLVLGKLLMVLPKGWACHVSPALGAASRPGSHHPYVERYAVLYRSSVLEVRWAAVVGQDAGLRRPPMLLVCTVRATGGLLAVVRCS
jgi:hypothetical protein